MQLTDLIAFTGRKRLVFGPVPFELRAIFGLHHLGANGVHPSLGRGARLEREGDAHAQRPDD